MPSNNPLTISVYETLESLDAVRLEWEALLAEYPYSTTFSTYEWLAAWWRAFGANDQLMVVAFRDPSSTLVGLAPLAITTRKSFPMKMCVLRLMGDGSHDSDNLDLPVKPGYEDPFAESLLDFFQKKSHAWDFAEFNTMLPYSPAAIALRKLLARHKWTEIEKQTPASAVPLPDTWEQYLALLLSEDQKNLIRYTKRLEKRCEVKFYRCQGEDQLEKSLEALFEHHQARWEAAGEQGSFASPARRQFYYELSKSLLARQWLDLWVLELNGKVAAAQFGFRYGRQVFQLQEGNDPAHASDRVGFVLRGNVMKQLIEEKIRTYDFLGGQLGYKARWGAQARTYTNLQFAQPHSVGSAYLQATRAAQRSKKWLREHLPQRGWDLLHKIKLKFRNPGRNETAAEEKPPKQSVPENAPDGSTNAER